MGELAPEKDTAECVLSCLLTNSRCFGVVCLVNIEKYITSYRAYLMVVLNVIVANHMISKIWVVLSKI